MTAHYAARGMPHPHSITNLHHSAVLYQRSPLVIRQPFNGVQELGHKMFIVVGEIDKGHAIETLAYLLLKEVMATLDQRLHQEAKKWVQEGGTKLILEFGM